MVYEACTDSALSDTWGRPQAVSPNFISYHYSLIHHTVSTVSFSSFLAYARHSCLRDLINVFYWSMIDLQYCINFCCTAKWYFFRIIFHYGLSYDIKYSSLCYTVGPFCLIHSTYSGLHLLIPNSQYIPLPLPPLGNDKSVLCPWVCLCFIDRFICVIFWDCACKWYMVFVFPCLTLLSMIISRCIHIAAYDIISSFLWLSNTLLYIDITSSLSIHLLLDI